MQRKFESFFKKMHERKVAYKAIGYSKNLNHPVYLEYLGQRTSKILSGMEQQMTKNRIFSVIFDV